jgi:flap endonuclease-1
MKGKKIGIDILGFLYKTKAQHQSIFTYLGKLIAACRKYGIIPVPIFDGKPPEEKREALKQRAALRVDSDAKKKVLAEDLDTVPMSEAQKSIVKHELSTLEHNSSYLTSEERDQAKQLFYACGVLFLNATGEADNLLSYFAKRGEFVAVMSNDLDLIARGVETLLVPDDYALPGDKSGWKQYGLTSILTSVNFTYAQFLEMCVLMGCDYTAGGVSMPYKSAFWAIQYRGSIDKTFRKLGIKDTAPYAKAMEILQGLHETPDSLMGEKQWLRWSAGVQPVEKEALDAFRKVELHGLSAEEYDLLQGNVDTLDSAAGSAHHH